MADRDTQIAAVLNRHSNMEGLFYAGLNMAFRAREGKLHYSAQNVKAKNEEAAKGIDNKSRSLLEFFGIPIPPAESFHVWAQGAGEYRVDVVLDTSGVDMDLFENRRKERAAMDTSEGLGRVATILSGQKDMSVEHLGTLVGNMVKKVDASLPEEKRPEFMTALMTALQPTLSSRYRFEQDRTPRI